MTKTTLFYSLLFVFNAVPLAHAVDGTHPYNPESLAQVIDAARRDADQNLHPVAIFDLDDTLFDSRTRTLPILQEFTLQSGIQKLFPAEARTFFQFLTLGGIRYELTDTVHDAGILNEDFIKQTQDYWAGRFFSDSDCAKDRPTPGAGAFVSALVRAGADVIYLTGRDEPRMGIGTALGLVKNHFPMGEHAHLMMRPDPKADELEFKKKAFETAEGMGHVIAGFENEPRNINAMRDRFPEGIMIFLDTIHSNLPDQVEDGVNWVANFYY